MPKIQHIFEQKDILTYLQERGLVKQYRKAKNFLLHDYQSQTGFKERNPKGSGIWSFRINRQYRALGVINEQNELIIFEIDNHQ